MKKLRRLRGAASSGLAVSVVRTTSKRYPSADALAESFGLPIFEPTWWPDDTRALTYRLDKSPSRDMYRIGSTRHAGTPICLLGLPGAQPEQTLPLGNWSRPPELATWRGLVRTNDAHIHAVLYHEQQTIHLIGYASESELVRAARSLRRVTAE